MQSLAIPNLPTSLTPRKISSFCRRWKVSELALFGSVLRADFRPNSDIDLMVTFMPEAAWSLFDLIQMQEELEELFGRPVDLVERDTIRNPFRKRTILGNLQVIYAAQ
jgi:predicted nucleotidyltransferase